MAVWAQRLAAVLTAIVLVVSIAWAAPDFPQLTGRVVDNANLLDAATEQNLTDKLAALEAETTDQLVVVTLPSLQGYAIEDFGFQLGRHWGIGQKDKNNGALLIVAPKERKVRIEVGYGLEGTLTDALTRIVIDKAILPEFKSGDYSGGIEAGVRDLTTALTQGKELILQREPQRSSKSLVAMHPIDLFFFFMIIFFMVLIFIAALRGRTFFVASSGRGGSSSSGGWSSGGSGGGFSGGGGSFGGGGSSGSW